MPDQPGKPKFKIQPEDVVRKLVEERAESSERWDYLLEQRAVPKPGLNSIVARWMGSAVALLLGSAAVLGSATVV